MAPATYDDVDNTTRPSSDSIFSARRFIRRLSMLIGELLGSAHSSTLLNRPGHRDFQNETDPRKGIRLNDRKKGIEARQERK